MGGGAGGMLVLSLGKGAPWEGLLVELTAQLLIPQLGRQVTPTLGASEGNPLTIHKGAIDVPADVLSRLPQLQRGNDRASTGHQQGTCVEGKAKRRELLGLLSRLRSYRMRRPGRMSMSENVNGGQVG